MGLTYGSMWCSMWVMDIVEVYGIIFTVMFNIGPCIQLHKIWKYKVVDGISVMMFIMCIVAHMSLMMYYVSYEVEGIFNYINSIIGMVLCVVIVISIMRFSR